MRLKPAVAAAAAVASLLLAAVALPWAYGRSKVATLSAPPRLVFARENAAIRDGGTAVVRVIIGDSRAAQWPRLPATPAGAVVNRGIGGETSPQLEARFAEDALSLRPRTVLIVSGINDIVAASFLAGEARHVAVAAIAPRFARLAAEAAGRGICAFATTLIPPAEPELWRRPVWRDWIFEAVAAVNTELRALGEGGLPLIDLAEVLAPGGQSRLPRAYATDTLHLDAGAYRLLEAHVAEVLARRPGCAGS